MMTEASTPRIAPHTLVRIRGVEALSSSEALPCWADDALRRSPWVVVRRARGDALRIPVGIRGQSRAARFAAFTTAREVLTCVTPQAIAAGRMWRDAARRDGLAAIAALPAVEGIMRAHGLRDHWGPTGSVGFELVCGHATAHPASDLDLAVQLEGTPSVAAARALHAALTALPVRTDVLLEMPHGALALADCVGASARWVLRTPDGPRWISAVGA